MSFNHTSWPFVASTIEQKGKRERESHLIDEIVQRQHRAEARKGERYYIGGLIDLAESVMHTNKPFETLRIIVLSCYLGDEKLPILVAKKMTPQKHASRTPRPSFRHHTVFSNGNGFVRLKNVGGIPLSGRLPCSKVPCGFAYQFHKLTILPYCFWPPSDITIHKIM